MVWWDLRHCEDQMLRDLALEKGHSSMQMDGVKLRLTQPEEVNTAMMF